MTACSGYFNDAYFRLLNTDLLYLSEDLDIFTEVQNERLEAEREAMKTPHKEAKREVIFEGSEG